MIKQNKMALTLLPIALMVSVFSFSNSFCIEKNVLSSEETKLIFVDCWNKNEERIVSENPEERREIFEDCYFTKMELLKKLFYLSNLKMDLETKLKITKKLDDHLNKELNKKHDDVDNVWLINSIREVSCRMYIESIVNNLKKNKFSENFNKILDTCCFNVKQRFVEKNN